MWMIVTRQQIIKGLFIFYLLISIFPYANSQYIKGIVLDRNTAKPVGYAVVYINGTFIGTYTDQEGVFELKIPLKLSAPVTVSSIGYFSVNVDNHDPGKPLIVYLTPKVYELKEVVVSASQKASGRARRANLKMFKTEFLGNTMNASKCEIENEDDIIFEFEPDSMILKAFCSKPILIDNKALGYKVAYYLDVFRFCGNDLSLLIAGNIIFREDASVDKNRNKIMERRRKSAYLGSRMHFFRELWADNLDSSGFLVRNLKNNILFYPDLVVQSENGRKYIKTEEAMIISYYSKYGGSRLSLVKDSVFFDRDGFYDALGITVWGEMGRLRLADWLPYEYL
jgi:hypothetical protein